MFQTINWRERAKLTKHSNISLIRKINEQNKSWHLVNKINFYYMCLSQILVRFFNVIFNFLQRYIFTCFL